MEDIKITAVPDPIPVQLDEEGNPFRVALVVEMSVEEFKTRYPDADD